MSIDKQQIRNQINQTITKILPAEREVISKKACENLREFLLSRHCRRVLCFASMADEIDTIFFLKNSKEFELYLPKVEKATRKISVHRINQIELDTKIGAYGILEPQTAAASNFANELDCIIVPARAIDFEGNRLGRGLGFYDRFLSQIKASHLLIACMVYHVQLISEVPVEDFDIPIEFCVSEKGAFHLRRRV